MDFNNHQNITWVLGERCGTIHSLLQLVIFIHSVQPSGSLPSHTIKWPSEGACLKFLESTTIEIGIWNNKTGIGTSGVSLPSNTNRFRWTRKGASIPKQWTWNRKELSKLKKKLFFVFGFGHKYSGSSNSNISTAIKHKYVQCHQNSSPHFCLWSHACDFLWNVKETLGFDRVMAWKRRKLTKSLFSELCAHLFNCLVVGPFQFSYYSSRFSVDMQNTTLSRVNVWPSNFTRNPTEVEKQTIKNVICCDLKWQGMLSMSIL